LEAETRISPLHRAYGNIRPTTGSPAQKIEKIDEKTYDAVVKQKVGPIKVTLKFRNVLTEVEEEFTRNLLEKLKGQEVRELASC
jgi:carbon monoxide dehydrogenase subunit G